VVTPNFFKASEVDCSQNASVQYDPDYGTQYFQYERGPLSFSAPAVNYTPSTYPALNYTTNQTTFDTTPYTYLGYRNSNDSWYQADTCSTANALLQNATRGTLERLSNEECIKAYGAGDGLITGRGSVLAVAKAQPAGNVNATVLLTLRYESFVSPWTGDNWVCDPAYLHAQDGNCDWETLAKTANTSWNLGAVEQIWDPYADGTSVKDRFVLGEQWPIDYCLGQQTDLGGVCKLQYSLIIMVCVVIANMVKFGVILYFLLSSNEPVLATIGDGIATFLQRPDPITANRPFLDRAGARKFKQSLVCSGTPYRERKRALRWWHAPSAARWSITLFLCTVTIIATGVLLSQGSRIANAYGLGFGNYNSTAILRLFNFNDAVDSADFSSNARLLAMVTVANIPQVLVSCLYFAYNTVYTSMVSADEWSRFTTHRKSLRTTDPAGLQRSTYWLSLPWTYGLPLAAASSFLHWLISEALFIARTEVLDTTGEPEPISYMEVGYSPSAILAALLFGSAMVVGMVVNGARKLKGGILVGNNSLAISAACHRPEKELDAHLRPVKWGALDMPYEDRKEGHCCFTSREVEPPDVGKLYI
jgi:hypothetical protein